MALIGQDFANKFLSRSTSWLHSIVFAVGPLGVPTVILAAIRVGGYHFLRVVIARSTEKEAVVERDLLSSTSRQVCELWDGKKVVRSEAAKPSIQELIYFNEKWYTLGDAMLHGILLNSKDTNTKKPERRREDEENLLEKEDTLPPNISLNLVPDNRS